MMTPKTITMDSRTIANNRLIPVLRFEDELQIRVSNSLQRVNINTLGELADKTEEELLRYKGFGKVSVDEIKSLLFFHGLELKGSNVKVNILIDEVGKALPTRIRNCLRRWNINTLGELTKVTEEELLSQKNVAEKSVSELKSWMNHFGLKLAELKRYSVWFYVQNVGEKTNFECWTDHTNDKEAIKWALKERMRLLKVWGVVNLRLYQNQNKREIHMQNRRTK